MVVQENNMAKKKEKQEEVKVNETKIVKQRKPKIQKTITDESSVVEQVEETVTSEPIAEVVEQIIIEENPWLSIVSTAESLYIMLQDEYNKQANNDVSSMLILMSSVIKSAKKRI